MAIIKEINGHKKGGGGNEKNVSYGYENEEGVYIKAGEKSDGDSKIYFCSNRPDKEHESIHISLNKDGGV